MPETTFFSSGTTGQIPSQHLVKSLDWYHYISTYGFEQQYGSLKDYCILGLLPSYLERPGASLVSMVDAFIKASKYEESGFFLDQFSDLYQSLLMCREKGIPTILWGVSFALLDFMEAYSIAFPELIIMETGGMKGRRKEMTRQELHQTLKQAFQVAHIHSEYGMTELLSQAYAPKNGRFLPTSAMKIAITDPTDPFTFLAVGKRGLINIIDLANLDTISFIATQDIGCTYDDGSFEVLGRHDASEVRGCNLMIAY